MKKVALLFTTLVLLLLSGWHLYRSNRPSEYFVILNVIPERISPRNIKVNTDFMILSHLYSPLFSVSEGGEIQSDFLDMNSTSAIGNDFTHFRICIKPQVTFSNGQLISLVHVIKGIQDFGSSGVELPSMKIKPVSDLCAEVWLSGADPKFFHKLATISATPLLNDNSDIAVGRGPYRISLIDPDRIILTSTDASFDGAFSKVHFIKFRSDLDLSKFWFADINQLPGMADKVRSRKGLQEIVRPSFKTYAIVVNHENEKLRKQFSDCFPREKFIPILPMRLKKISGFFPQGAAGSNKPWREDQQDQTFAKCAPSEARPLTFYFFDPNQEDGLQRFFADFQAKLPLRVALQNLDLNSIIRKMYRSDNLATVVGFDSIGEALASDSDGMSYIEYFVASRREKRLVSTVNQKLSRLAKKIRSASNRSDRIRLMTEAHAELMKSGQVIPLGELETVQLYPKEISNILWLGPGSLSGFPNIAKMRWSRRWWE